MTNEPDGMFGFGKANSCASGGTNLRDNGKKRTSQTLLNLVRIYHHVLSLLSSINEIERDQDGTERRRSETGHSVGRRT